jgi:hypothetical protein
VRVTPYGDKDPHGLSNLRHNLHSTGENRQPIAQTPFWSRLAIHLAKLWHLGAELDEIRSQRHGLADFLKPPGPPETMAVRIVFGDEDDGPRDAVPAQAPQARRRKSLSQAPGTEVRRNRHVIDEAAPAIVAAKRGADDYSGDLGTRAQAWIALEVGAKGSLVIAFCDLDSVGVFPKIQNSAVVGRRERANLGFRLHIPIKEYIYYRMNLGAFKDSLRRHPAKNVRLLLPDGDPIPAEFHVTEVGHLVRSFIDCGGTIRRVETCLLQAWVAGNDPDHRLSAEKLARILEMAAPVVPSDSLEVEIEYQPCCVAHYTVDQAEPVGGELLFHLAHKQTDCLAREACGLVPAGSGERCEGEGCCS